MPSDVELVRDRGALLLQLVPHRSRRGIQVVFFVWRGRPRPRVIFAGVRSFSPGRRERLRLLASIAINRDSLQSKLPGLQVSFHDVFHRCALGKIDGLRYSSGDKRLRRRHHPQMSHVSNRARALRRLERTIEDGEMIVLHMRRAFDSAGRVDIADDSIRLIVIVTELKQRRRHRLINNLNHPSAHELLVLNQRQIRLHAGCIAVHHETDGAGGGQDCDLAVSVAVFFAVGEGFVPALFAGFVDVGGDIIFIYVVDAGAVHADYVEEGFAIDVPAGSGTAGHGLCRGARFARWTDECVRPHMGIAAFCADACA